LWQFPVIQFDALPLTIIGNKSRRKVRQKEEGKGGKKDR